MAENKVYQRIIILGAGGSGKTTLAKSLSNLTGINAYYLDKEYWLPNWQRPSDDDWNHKLNDIIANEQWIIDGNYIDSLNKRLAKADLVIMLDINKNICTKSIFFRTLKNYFWKRSDLGNGCTDRFNERYKEFLAWSKAFKQDYFPLLIKKCLEYPNVDLKIFKSRSSAKHFIKTINKKEAN